jgi:hypothetical protein
MKTSLSFFVFLFSVLTCSSQGYFTVYSPTIVPQNPTTADQISILVKVMSPSGSGKLSKSWSVNQNQVDLSSCIGVYATSAITYQTDTFNIGQLPAGIYNISYTATASFSNTCVPSGNTSTMTATFTVSSVTSLKEANKDHSVSFFPNPFIDKISVKSTEKETLTNILVMNILGKPVAVFDRLTEGDEINLEKLPRGIYWLKYEYADKSKTVKLIKGNP